MKKLIPLFLVPFVLTGCKKKEDENFPPTIEIVSVSESTVTQFDNQVLLVLKYTDPDGDLGYGDADSLSLTIKDSRLQDPDWYFIPPLSPNGTQLSIEGNLEVQLHPFFLLGNGTSETIELTVQLQDKQGNWSNAAISPSITVTQ